MMNDNEKELRKVLLESTPVLFLGAGFSYGSKNENGELPRGKELFEQIYKEFIDDSFSQKDKEEIKGYKLKELCQVVYDSLKKKDELQKFIISKLEHAQPEKFHLLLNCYPWNKIYSINIDDLVENIYHHNGFNLIVQNKGEEKKSNGEPELIKLHGCVNAPEEGIVFSESEYNALITKRSFKLESLTTDIISRNVIFIGASMEESDIDFYISKYEHAGFLLRKGKLIFIDPQPKLKLKSRVEALGGILFEWTTEHFLQYLASLNYNPTEQDRNKKALNYAGFYLYGDILQIQSGNETYESRLYEGFTCNWKDVIHEWVFDTTYISEIKGICDVRGKIDGAYCIALYGNHFTGKACALKQLGAYLHKVGYTVIEFKGRSFRISALKHYIESSTQEKFVLLVENAPFSYKMIERLLQAQWNGKSLLIITTSLTYYHFKKKYYLEDNPFMEIEMGDKINNINAGIIYKKIKEKGYTGGLPEKEADAIAQICKSGSFINLFSDLTYGKGFVSRLKNASINIMNASEKVKSLYLELIIFHRADLGYYPSELFVQQYDVDLNIFMEKNLTKLNSEQKVLVDYLRFDENGLVLKNRLLVDMLWQKVSTELVLNELKYILENISSYISEDSNTYWRIIFESLLKEDILDKKFHLNSSQILDLYYGLKDYYSEISYYWLQLGIAEQRKKDYSKALNHLLMAHRIKPRAYQIQHAIARNYLKNANDEKNEGVALELFKTGEKKMLELINSKENYKKKAKYFSIHCYVHEKINFYKKYPNQIQRSELKKMKNYINSIVNEKTPYLEELLKEFVILLKEHNMLDILTMKLGDKYYKALYSTNIHLENMDEEDWVVDSY